MLKLPLASYGSRRNCRFVQIDRFTPRIFGQDGANDAPAPITSTSTCSANVSTATLSEETVCVVRAEFVGGEAAERVSKTMFPAPHVKFTFRSVRFNDSNSRLASQRAHMMKTTAVRPAEFL